MKKIILKVSAALLATAGFIAPSYAGKLPRLSAKLESGQNTRIVFFGDSVTGGYGVNANAYPRKFAQRLKSKYPNSNVLYYGKDLRIWPNGTYGAGSNTCHPAYSHDNPVNPEYIGKYISNARTITVIADGIGGSNVARFMARLTNAPSEFAYNRGYKEMLIADDPFRADIAYTAIDADAVFMMFGINDSLLPTNSGPSTVLPDAGLACYQNVRYNAVPLNTRGTFYSVFRYQYRVAINSIRQRTANNPEIALITPNRVGNAQQNTFMTNQYSNPVLEFGGWADATFDVTGLFNMQSQHVYTSWMLDVNHPNALGHEQIANLIFNQY